MEDKTLCEYETVGIHTIRPHPRNPRKGDVDLIEESINENGFFDPIGVQKSTGFIIDGNHRWKAAKKLGMEIDPKYVAVCLERISKLGIEPKLVSDG